MMTSANVPGAELCGGCKRSGLNLLVCDDGEVGRKGKSRYCVKCMIGHKVKVFWPVDEQWYTGVVQEYDAETGEHKLTYPDGDEEWVKIGENGGQQNQSSPGMTAPPTSHSKSPPDDNSPPKGRTPEHRISGGSGAQFNHSPNKHPQMYEVMGGMHPGGPFNPYHPHPSFPGMGGPGGQAPFGSSFNGPGGAFPPYDMRQGLPFPQHGNSRMMVSPTRSRRDSPQKDSSSPSRTRYATDSSEKPSSGGKKKSGPKTWSKEEDTQLLSMVQKMRMPIKWSLVSQSMPERTGKQCRERYVNHLNPRLKSCDWSPSEDATIFHLYNTCGSQWAKMSKMIPGRTDNGIKNRFHNLRRQLEREDEHRVRLSKPDDFPDEVQLDRIRQLPKHLRGKCDDLWDMSDGVGVLAAQSVLGGSFARNAGRFGPFKKADVSGEQCARCGLFAPSTHCGMQICTKSKWCVACTRLPPHMCGNILRECLNLRRIEEDNLEGGEENKLIKAGALNLALADAK
mmetsp:Transcript_6384/g.7156  ORF Transcript_6384/g.7156 Transcript_6384/m.7156 type:complete len:508 (-) Transcript_6384:37-1560(-)